MTKIIGILHFIVLTLLYFTDIVFSLQTEGLGSPASSKSIYTIFPKAFAHSVFL